MASGGPATFDPVNTRYNAKIAVAIRAPRRLIRDRGCLASVSRAARGRHAMGVQHVTMMMVIAMSPNVSGPCGTCWLAYRRTFSAYAIMLSCVRSAHCSSWRLLCPARVSPRQSYPHPVLWQRANAAAASMAGTGNNAVVVTSYADISDPAAGLEGARRLLMLRPAAADSISVWSLL